MSAKTKTCTHCGETKPLDAFKRRLTKRQSCALLLRSSISQGITVDSVRCSTCWHMTKSKKPLTPKQIRNKMNSGDLKWVLGNIMLKELKEATPQKRSRVMKEEWQKRKTGWVKILNANLQHQVDTYKNRYCAYKSTHKNLKGEDGENSLREKQYAMLEQHRQNYEQAKQIKRTLMEKVKAGEQVAVDVQIVLYFRKELHDV